MSFLFLNCGYEVTVKKSLPYGTQNVFVEMFRNDTEELALESIFTNKLIRRLVRHMPGSVVFKTNADIILRGAIESLQTQRVLCGESSSFNDSKRLVMVATMVLENSEGQVFWRSEQFRETHDYITVVEGKEICHTNRENSILILLDKMADSAIQILTEKF